MMDRKLIVLIVDDNFSDVEKLRRHLGRCSGLETVVRAISHSQSRANVLAHRDVDIIFVGYSFDRSGEFNTVRYISELAATAPIIVLTPPGSEGLAVVALKAGATDYLGKDRLSPQIIQKAIVESIQDSSIRRRTMAGAEDSVRRAITDELTGCYNPAYFMWRLTQETRRARRYGAALSCWKLDVDCLGKINDACGRPAGDLVVSTVAKILLRYSRSTDIVARSGGGAFYVVAPETAMRDALVAADRIRSRIALQVFSMDSGVLRVTCSVGVAEVTSDVTDAADLVGLVDKSLAEAKSRGRDRVVPTPPANAALSRP